MKTTRGFTLIELLVAIAIIGILASVVVGSVTRGRDRGADAAVQSDLDTIRTQAEIVFGDDSDYDAICGINGATQDAKIAEAIAHASSTAGGPGVCGAPLAGPASAWAISSPLKTGGHWCVDSQGSSLATTSAIALTDTACQ
ncbi:MAG: type II secretion system protein [Candidatus Paceibacterota bacterium]|jgi:prepilin-type N-terminal cleavage/methylation domain-containing protein